MPSKIYFLRLLIDMLDFVIAFGVLMRLQVAVLIGRAKLSENASLNRDSLRENAVYANYRKILERKSSTTFVESLSHLIIEESCRLQEVLCRNSDIPSG